MNEIINFLVHMNSSQDLLSISIRTVIIYGLSIYVFRIGNPRFLLQTPFDFILPIIFGSVLSRGINGTASLLSTIVACALLVLLHWVFGYFSFLSHKFGRIVKGRSQILVLNGVVNWPLMRKNQITEHDLHEEARRQLNVNSLENIEQIRLERNGMITFVKEKNN